MKISSQRLKKIILEELAKVAVNESHDSGENLRILGTGGAAFATALDEVEEDFKLYYDPNDPSMEGADKQSWDYQVSMAREEFEEKLVDLYHSVESKLLDGGYAPGNWEGPSKTEV